MLATMPISRRSCWLTSCSRKNIAEAQARMPNRNGMTTTTACGRRPAKQRWHRQWRQTRREERACMSNCKTEVKVASGCRLCAENRLTATSRAEPSVGPVRGDTGGKRRQRPCR